ncbi:MAG: YjbF family lipoprotein [Pseudomonadota bacterium]
MNWKLPILASAAIALLSACNNQGVQNTALRVLLDEQAGGGTGGAFPRFQPLLAAGRGPALDVSIPARQVRGGFLLEDRIGTIESWLGNDGVGLTFDRGILHGTRGAGAGILSSDVAASARAVMSGSNVEVERLHTFLNGNNLARTRAYTCQIRNQGSDTIELDIGLVNTRRMEETCRNLNQEFTNTYWVDTSRNRVLKSRQWAGEFLGEMTITTVFNF